MGHDILKIEARVAPIFFRRGRRPSWRTRRAQDDQADQDKARGQQEVVSMSTIFFLKLQTGEFENHEFYESELINIELEAQAWATVEEKGYLQDTRQGVLLALRWGKGDEFYVP